MSRTISFSFASGEANTNIYNLNIGQVRNFKLKSFNIQNKIGSNPVYVSFNNPSWLDKSLFCIGNNTPRYHSFLFNGVNRQDKHPNEKYEDDNFVSHFDLTLYEVSPSLAITEFTGHENVILEFEYDVYDY